MDILHLGQQNLLNYEYINFSQYFYWSAAIHC